MLPDVHEQRPAGLPLTPAPTAAATECGTERTWLMPASLHTCRSTCRSRDVAWSGTHTTACAPRSRRDFPDGRPQRRAEQPRGERQ
ncbi:hypothetical protein GA0115246_103061, partial [Streptomyces sp. SolWspMP-sol7th]